MVSRAATTFFLLGFGVTTVAWTSEQADQCQEQCLSSIDPKAGSDTCYAITQGKPVKACLSSFRDAAKKTCNKVCSEGDISHLSSDSSNYCDYARHELPRPTVHRACITGYSSAFDKIASFFHDNPIVLQGGIIATRLDDESEEDEDEHSMTEDEESTEMLAHEDEESATEDEEEHEEEHELEEEEHEHEALPSEDDDSEEEEHHEEEEEHHEEEEEHHEELSEDEEDMSDDELFLSDDDEAADA